MADITIHPTLVGVHHLRGTRAGIIWKDDSGGGVGYVTYLDSGNNLVMETTADGGASWAAVATISTALIRDYSARAEDESGIASTRIIVAYIDATNSKVAFRAFDMDGETLESEKDVATGLTISSTGTWEYHCIDVVRGRGTNIYIAATWDKDLTNKGFFRSEDGGATWGSRSNTGIDQVSKVWLFPGGETDAEDVLLVDLTDTPDLGVAGYDNSADTWGTRAVPAIPVGTPPIAFQAFLLQAHGVHRQSDNHALFVVVPDVDFVGGAIMTLDITGPGTINIQENVLTNTDEIGMACLFINQQNDDVYCAYTRGGTWASLTDVYYKKSIDGMNSWGSEVQVSETQDDLRTVWAGGFVDNEGGRFMPMWFNDDLNDLMTNKDNSVALFTEAPFANVSAVAGPSLVSIYTLERPVLVTGAALVTPGSAVSLFPVADVTAALERAPVLLRITKTPSGLAAVALTAIVTPAQQDLMALHIAEMLGLQREFAEDMASLKSRVGSLVGRPVEWEI